MYIYVYIHIYIYARVTAGVGRSLSASAFTSEFYELVGRPFKPSKHLDACGRQVHLGLLYVLDNFFKHQVSLEPKPGKIMEITKELVQMRSEQLISLRSVMTLAGKLIFLLMACFNKLARGGLQPFFEWLANNAAYDCSTSIRLDTTYRTTPSLLLATDFFIRGLQLLQPRIYTLGSVNLLPIIIYSDAEWTILDEPPWLRKGLGGILWDDDYPSAAALDTPHSLVEALPHRKTQIIPLELMAAAGMLHTYGNMLRGRDVIFFIDNQSVCSALTKGCSRAWDIQIMATAWHLTTMKLGCRVWIEWVPSDSNPADILSRHGKSLFKTANGKVDELILPDWVNIDKRKSINFVLDSVGKEPLSHHISDVSPHEKSLTLGFN